MKKSRIYTFSVATDDFAVVNYNVKSHENIEKMSSNHNKSTDSFWSSSYSSEKHYIHVISTIYRVVTGRYYFTQFCVGNIVICGLTKFYKAGSSYDRLDFKVAPGLHRCHVFIPFFWRPLRPPRPPLSPALRSDDVVG